MPLEVRGLVKRYGRILAVNNLSFTLEEGKILGLVGPNGAGKTTTIKSILGLVKPQKGEILVDGLPTNNPEARKKLGYSPELPEAPEWITPRQLLENLALMEGLSLSEARREAKEALETLGVLEYADRKIGKLSKGLKKRVLIAQALINRNVKKYLLMDEPLTGLDPSWVVKVRTLIRRLREEGLSILVSSHLLRELEDIIDDVVIIRKGVAVFVGSLEELAEKYGKGGIIEARVEKPEEVARTLKNMGLVECVMVEGDTVKAILRKGVAAEEVVQLVYRVGGMVKSVTTKIVSLEDVYEQLVRGE